jgi:hypothetical protein
VTEHPTAEWTSQQVVEAFREAKAPRFMTRDRDAVYGLTSPERLRAHDIEAVVIAPQNPWQSPCVERVFGRLRRECLDHVSVLGKAHLRRIVGPYVGYYQSVRTHLALEKDALKPRAAAGERECGRNSGSRPTPSSV